MTERLGNESRRQIVERSMKLGIYSFGDRAPDPRTGEQLSVAQTLANTLERIKLADELGLGFYGLGEHHLDQYSISSPGTVLAAAASITDRITLSSAVTVLSTEDPVRVYQQFTTLDQLSHGRAELLAGRGSFTESFPLFGYDLEDYDTLFEEKLDLFVRLLDEKPVTWSGTLRPPLDNADVYPKTESGRLSTWVGVGGSPQSVIRTAHHGLPLMLAIIGGPPQRFAPYVDLYRRAAAQFGTTAHPVGVHSPGFVADTDEEAREVFWPRYRVIRDRIGALRGWPPIRREEFDHDIEHGSLYIGSPDTVARKIAGAVKDLGVGRFDLIYSSGSQPASARLRAVELYGGKVIPMVRDILSEAK